MTRLVYKQNNTASGDFHVAHADFRNLTEGQYSDGINKSFNCTTSSSDLSELFNTPAFSLCSSMPKGYLSRYLDYTQGYRTFIMLPSYEMDMPGILGIGTAYVCFNAIDTKAQDPEANFSLSKVSAKDIQSGEKDYNTAYTVILKDNNKSLKQRVNITATGNGNAQFEMLNEDGKAFTSIDTTAGTKMILRMKASEADTVLKSISVQQHNDATDLNKVTSETTLFDEEEIGLLDVDEDGYYIFDFTVPYSNVTLCLNTEKGYNVYAKGTGDLNDLITLDSYTTLFLEGETVNFIADDAVESVVLKYGSTTQEIPLEVTGDSERMGSFVMLAGDVTLIYEGTNCSHEYSDNGFCKKCGVYEPATLNKNGVYEIGNAGQLYWFGALVMGDRSYAQFDEQNGSANAVLTNDIVVNEGEINASSKDVRVWIPIGEEDSSYMGQGHTINGLYFKDSNADHVGLFGYTRGGADIYNVGVVNSYLEGRNDVGGIIGRNNNNGVTVQRCYSEATIVGNNNVAGIIGSTYGGTIDNCYNADSVSGNTYVGSIQGYNNNGDTSSKYWGTIRNCFNVDEVTGTGTSNISGLSGDGNASISNCYCIDTQLTDTAATTKTAEEFASGEVAYLLNNGVTDGTQVWYQNINNGQKADAYPVFAGGTVYYGYKMCGDDTKGYSNYQLSDLPKEYSFHNGFCEICGAYQAAILNESGVYEISNAGQLYWFGALVMGNRSYAQFDEQNGAANAVLTNDIVVNEGVINASSKNVRIWIPIGTENSYYTGQFDGQGHTISGLYFKDSNADYVGLFGFVRGGTDIYNVGVVNSYLEGRNNVGGIVGYNSNSGVTVNRCFSEATVVGNNNVAGISGFFYGGAIVDCYHAGSGTGNTYVASIRGKNTHADRGEIRNCFNVGEVTGTGSNNVGGIRGDGNGTIDNCYCIDTQLTDTAAITKTAEEFASGEVAYLLNNGVTNGTQIWYQNINNGQKADAYPVFEGGTVY